MGRPTIISSCGGQGRGQLILRVCGGGAHNAPQRAARVSPHRLRRGAVSGATALPDQEHGHAPRVPGSTLREEPETAK